MPPRPSAPTSFSASDQPNEVICSLKNQDGTNCRKRCLGEKRFRSMQEHIRRAHPPHYIPKLPATEESIQLMISTPPSARTPGPQTPTPAASQSLGSSGYGHDRDQQTASPIPPRTIEDAYPAAATAAVALAQLHNQSPRRAEDWGPDAIRQDHISDHDPIRPRTSSSLELPPIQNNYQPRLGPPFQSPRPREALPSLHAQSPPGRSTTLPPIDRHRTRKNSLTNARKPKHERNKSREFARRMSIDGRKAYSAEPPSAAKMAMGRGNRWEDLLEAATSANEADSDRDLTPIPHSPTSMPASRSRYSLPPFPSTLQPSADPYKASPLQHALTPPPASPSPSNRHRSPFPSVEGPVQAHHLPHPLSSSHQPPHDRQHTPYQRQRTPYQPHLDTSSGSNFHMPSSGLSSAHSHSHSLSGGTNHFSHASMTSTDTTPQTNHNTGPHHHLLNPTTHPSPHDRNFRESSLRPASEATTLAPSPFPIKREIRILCASCRRAYTINECYVCTECIHGFCVDCVYKIGGQRGDPTATSQSAWMGCPTCGQMGRFKPIRLDFV